ncbi:Na-translocating system protein MpsC family protein [Bacillus solitudinis]|uniref:Na-translocating system protein MpsC family protein n=1 Tax=Bacillus solitudinis TaxID=2014074 RepID=UPI000C246C2C|nr:Na-translocating system protein MpsC family protein [Bacillus solitudinis]
MEMNKTRQENLTYLSSYLSKIIKRNFGKGPETCFTFLQGHYLLVHIRHFMTPAEEVLMENNELRLAKTFRSTILHAVINEFKIEIEKLLNKNFEPCISDWNYYSNTGLLMFVENSIEVEQNVEYRMKERLAQLIGQLCTNFHKVPERIECFNVHNSICIIECEGVLTEVEHILHENNCLDILTERTERLKLHYLKYKDSFEKVFSRSVEDVYIMWDHVKNKKYIAFYLKDI